MHMTDRKIRKSALCITMSLVLTLCGCAAAAPASGQGSTGQEASGQGSTMQANAGQEVTGEATPGQEATGQEATAQEANGQEISAQTTVQEDEFDFEEGDQSTPAAEEMPSKFDLRDVQVKGSGIVLGSGLAQDDGYTAETFNLSEKHLSFFAYTALNAPEDPQNGEGKKSSVPLTGSQKMQGGDPQDREPARHLVR